MYMLLKYVYGQRKLSNAYTFYHMAHFDYSQNRECLPWHQIFFLGFICGRTHETPARPLIMGGLFLLSSFRSSDTRLQKRPVRNIELHYSSWNSSFLLTMPFAVRSFFISFFRHFWNRPSIKRNILLTGVTHNSKRHRLTSQAAKDATLLLFRNYLYKILRNEVVLSCDKSE